MDIQGQMDRLISNLRKPHPMSAIARLNADPAVDAYLIHLPLPSGLDEEAALLAVDPATGCTRPTWGGW